MLAVDTRITIRIVTNAIPEQVQQAVALFQREQMFVSPPRPSGERGWGEGKKPINLPAPPAFRPPDPG